MQVLWGEQGRKLGSGGRVAQVQILCHFTILRQPRTSGKLKLTNIKIIESRQQLLCRNYGHVLLISQEDSDFKCSL